MHTEKNSQEESNKRVDIGNASNAGPHDEKFESAANENQLLGKEAEKYMRQVTSPEEAPDAEESQELDDEADGNEK
ncbi:MAG TPA: hypothetical protein VMR70_12915 [Flavisolibacter sp.]|nr:hypothetical protein [Flavisolibacter sp.]